MSTPPPRNLRRFRPLTDLLEGLAPVSSLVPWLPATATAASFGYVRPGADHSAPTQPGTADSFRARTAMPIPKSTANSVVLVRASDTTTDGGFDPISSTVTITASRPLVSELVRTSTSAARSIVPVPTMTPSMRMSFAALPRSGGIVLNTAPRPTAPTPPIAPAGPAATTAPAEVAADTDGIRLMVLAPQSRDQGTSLNSFEVMSDGGDSNLADDPPPPVVSGLGSGQVQGPDLPVGSYTDFYVMDPGGGWSINTDTIRWSGGTDYSDYFDDDATTTVQGSPWLQSVVLVQSVATDWEDYTFIVDAEEKQYTITVNCSYYDPDGGPDIPAPPTTITFNSVRPTVASIQGTAGFETFYTTADRAVLQYSDNDHPWNGGPGHGFVINAQTQTGEFGGDFMFLQLVDLRLAETSDNGASHHLANVGGGANLDNGTLGDNLPLGMALVSPPSPVEGTGWTLPASSALTSTQTYDPAPLALSSQLPVYDGQYKLQFISHV